MFWKVFEIGGMILLPLAWGLAVEWAFSRLRRRGRQSPAESCADDWVI
jgi:hypothetical protein